MNKIINADCIEAMKAISNNTIDMILCDLPYGTTNCPWDQVIPFEQLWEQYKRIIKDNGAIVLFSQQPFTTDLINSNRKWFRYEWIWEKQRALGFLNAKKMPLRSHEVILVFYKKLPIYNPQFTKGKPYTKKENGKAKTSLYNVKWKEYSSINTGTRYPRDVIRITGKDDGHYHPTQKPVELAEYLIKTYTNPGEVVLDNCVGSGTTCVAAIRTGRRYIGIEKDIKYAEIAKRRCHMAALEFNAA
jgi:site-specific DNA-methyltransferase (adenine-specific)